MIINSAEGCSIFAQIWYRVWSCETRSTTNVQECQRSRSQRDVTPAKMWEITNNFAADCSISVKFSTEFEHLTPDLYNRRSRSRSQTSRSQPENVVWSPNYCSLFRRSLNLMVTSEFWCKARKWQFVRMHSTNFAKTAQNDWLSGDLQVAMHLHLPRF